MQLSAKRAIGLRGEKEIGLGEAVDLVRPDLDAAPTPADVQVRMMTLLLGDLADAIRERQRPREVAELVAPQQVAGRSQRPAGLELLSSSASMRSRGSGGTPPRQGMHC